MAKTNYDERIEKLAEDYVDSNYDSFTKGKDYAALEKRYSDQGRRAMDDTVGQIAARTGGLASSYAASAGQQAYGEYMGRLEDAARGLYDSQQSEKLSRLGVARDMQEYQRSEAERALSDFSNDVYMDMYLAGDEDLANMKYEDLAKTRTAIPEGFGENDFEMLRRQVQGGRAATVGDSESEYPVFNVDYYRGHDARLDKDTVDQLVAGGDRSPGVIRDWESIYGKSYYKSEIERQNIPELLADAEKNGQLDIARAVIEDAFDEWINYNEEEVFDYLWDQDSEEAPLHWLFDRYGLNKQEDDKDEGAKK